MKKSFLLSVITLLLLSEVYSQGQEVLPPPHIQTINFPGSSPEDKLPVLRLGEQLRLTFDDIDGNEKDYYYVIEHYNFDWEKTNLAKSEYLEGFDDVNIDRYENSFNTLQMYTHYVLTIPNRDTRAITKSGNYLLKIYDDRGKLQFSRKFMVYENVANVGVSVRRSRDMRFIHTKQVVNFIVNSPSLLLINPDRNVKTLVVQNGNLKTAIRELKPQYTMGNDLIYKYDQESAFWGGNEYLNFDNSDVRAATINIRRVELEDLYVNYLYTDLPRYDKPYTYNPDINGNFVVRNIRGQNEAIDAEYVWLNFSLKYFEDLEGKDIHVYGNFNNFTPDYSTKMIYDSYTDTYRLKRLFKQGFYNYKYIVVDKDETIDEGAVSGNFDETENDYKVLVYYREPGGRYDRIIGVGTGSSLTISDN